MKIPQSKNPGAGCKTDDVSSDSSRHHSPAIRCAQKLLALMRLAEGCRFQRARSRCFSDRVLLLCRLVILEIARDAPVAKLYRRARCGLRRNSFGRRTSRQLVLDYRFMGPGPTESSEEVYTLAGYYTELRVSQPTRKVCDDSQDD